MDLRIGKGFNQVEATLIGHTLSILVLPWTKHIQPWIPARSSEMSASWVMWQPVGDPKRFRKVMGANMKLRDPRNSHCLLANVCKYPPLNLPMGKWPIYRWFTVPNSWTWLCSVATRWKHETTMGIWVAVKESSWGCRQTVLLDVSKHPQIGDVNLGPIHSLNG